MENRIKQIIEDKIVIDISLINDGSNLYDDLGFDSLDLVVVTMCLDEEYDISINDDDAESWQTIDDIARTCKEYIEAKKN